MSQSHPHEVKILPQFKIATGIDIHKDSIVTYIGSVEGSVNELKTWDTYTGTLRQIATYLKEKGSECALMESTGVYWMSLYHILKESGLEVVVANPQHIKGLPKQKTDKKDAKWLCKLALNGLVRGSFVPDDVQKELRECCRMRETYKNQETQSTNRIVKILERANIKLRSVSQSIRTKTCRSIIEAIISGESDVKQLSVLAQGSLKKKKEELEKAVEGFLNETDKEELIMLREDINHYKKQKEKLEEKINRLQKAHYEEEVRLLERISGIGEQSAQEILSEMGKDMSKFATGDHLTSWAGLSPGNSESAGKRRNISTRKGNKHLRTTMVTVAWGAVRTKKSYWSYLYGYYKSKMPAKKAIIAIARKMLKMIYTVLIERKEYNEGGEALYLQIVNKNREMRERRYRTAD